MGYGDGLDMDTLISAMKDKALQDTTDLQYLGACEIIPHLAQAEMIAKPMIFIIPQGSPETIIAEGAAETVKRAEHNVEVYAAIFTVSEADEDSVVGAGDAMGVVEHAQNVLKFYGGNLLGLSGIDTEKRPSVQVPTNGYQSIIVEEDGEPQGWLNICKIEYVARTLAYAESVR